MHGAVKQWLALCWLVLAAGGASAHAVPPSTVMIDVGRSAVDVELQLQLTELGSALGLPLAQQPGEVIARHGATLRRYIAAHVTLRAADGRPYAIDPVDLDLRRTANPEWSGNDWLVVRLHARPPAGATTEVIGLDYSVIMDRVMSHNAAVLLRRNLRLGLAGDQPVPIGLMGFQRTHLDIDGRGGSAWRGLGRMVLMGVEHIAGGADHLLFLLTLLVPASLVARGSQARGLRAVIGIVTGFTLGHSLTLALASLGWVAPPGRAVEVLVGLTIVLAALHALRPVLSGRETLLAAAFGLVHGLAFSSALADMRFDGWTLALGLAGFNLGIEVMQLLVIFAALPLLLALQASGLGRVARIACAAFAFACGVAWTAARAFGMESPLQQALDRMSPLSPWVLAATGAGGLACLAVARALSALRASPPASAP